MDGPERFYIQLVNSIYALEAEVPAFFAGVVSKYTSIGWAKTIRLLACHFGDLYFRWSQR
jgi:hypothetical protein